MCHVIIVNLFDILIELRTRRRSRIENMDDRRNRLSDLRFSSRRGHRGYLVYSSEPVHPIIVVSDEEGYEHTWIHFAQVDSSESTGMTRIDFGVGILVKRVVKREGWAGMVRVEIEKAVSLRGAEVMR